jgi:hypothetical protein
MSVCISACLCVCLCVCLYIRQLSVCLCVSSSIPLPSFLFKFHLCLPVTACLQRPTQHFKQNPVWRLQGPQGNASPPPPSPPPLLLPSLFLITVNVPLPRATVDDLSSKMKDERRKKKEERRNREGKREQSNIELRKVNIASLSRIFNKNITIYL